jgi:cytochrome c553
MELRWKHIAIALAVFPVAAVLFAWIGFFNIGASSGHWPVTNWALHSAMRAAVKTYAFLDVDVPDRLPTESIPAAAGHFARGCAGCHGAPGEEVPKAVQRMLPPPPDLAGKVGEWNDAELFWIVKHGVRFTGMPAWPTQSRDDEVWAMVAFLRDLPAMSADTYRAMAVGEAGRLEMEPHGFADTLAECSRCHDPAGSRSGGILPLIAGQQEDYLLDALRAYAEPIRPSGMMALPVSASEKQVLPELARHFARQRTDLGPIPTGSNDGSAAARLVFFGDPNRAIPACIGCHGEKRDRHPAYPYIAGQAAPYVAGQLHLFRSGARGGGPNAHLMRKAAEHLSDHDIEILAAFLSRAGGKSATPAAKPR